MSPAGLVLAIGPSSSPEIQIDADRFARLLILTVSTKKKSRTKPKRATKIMLIRHAEKPAKDGAPFGITAKGERSKESLEVRGWQRAGALANLRSEEHTSELQSPCNLVCRLLLEKNNVTQSSCAGTWCVAVRSVS